MGCYQGVCGVCVDGPQNTQTPIIRRVLLI